MKKIILIMIVLFVANVACKKTSLNGGNICACSPIQGPVLYLVIKNSSGQDLLSDKTTGAFTKDKIQLYRIDNAGKTIQLNFELRPQFDYGNDKFTFNQLFSYDLSFLQKGAASTAYLKLGDKIYELSIELGSSNFYRIDKVSIDKKVIEKDNGPVANYVPIFYFTPAGI